MEPATEEKEENQKMNRDEFELFQNYRAARQEFKKATQELLGDVIVVDKAFMEELELCNSYMDPKDALTETCRKFNIAYDGAAKKFVRIKA